MKTVSKPSKHQGSSDLTKLSVIKDNDNKAILPCFSGSIHINSTVLTKYCSFGLPSDLEDTMETGVLSTVFIEKKSKSHIWSISRSFLDQSIVEFRRRNKESHVQRSLMIHHPHEQHCSLHCMWNRVLSGFKQGNVYSGITEYV